MPSPLSPHHPFFKYRSALLVSIVILVPLGYVIRFISDHWLNDFLGSIAYEIVWMLLVLVILPTASLVWTAISVCLATCAIEFLQLWQDPLIQSIRATFLGRLILGNTFLWSDFPSYFIGSFLGWGWAKVLRSV